MKSKIGNRNWKLESRNWKIGAATAYLFLGTLAFAFTHCGGNATHVTAPGQTPDSPLSSIARMNDVLANSTRTATVTVKALATAGKINTEDAGAVLTVLGNIDVAGLKATALIDQAVALDAPTAQALRDLFNGVARSAIELTTNGNLFVKNPTHKAEVVAAINLIASSASVISQGISAINVPLAIKPTPVKTGN
jgi:hypothetical protein